MQNNDNYLIKPLKPLDSYQINVIILLWIIFVSFYFAFMIFPKEIVKKTFIEGLCIALRIGSLSFLYIVINKTISFSLFCVTYTTKSVQSRVPY